MTEGLQRLLREKLERSRQETVEFSERWLHDLEVLVRNDTAPVRIDGEKRENVRELPQYPRSAA